MAVMTVKSADQEIKENKRNINLRLVVGLTGAMNAQLQDKKDVGGSSPGPGKKNNYLHILIGKTVKTLHLTIKLLASIKGRFNLEETIQEVLKL